MHVKFCSVRMLFTIQSTNLFFIHNFILQKPEILTFVWWHSNWSLIFLKFWNFTSIKNIIKTCNLMVRFSNFTLNIKIYDKFEGLYSKLIWRETLFFRINNGHIWHKCFFFFFLIGHIWHKCFKTSIESCIFMKDWPKNKELQP